MNYWYKNLVGSGALLWNIKTIGIPHGVCDLYKFPL